jgi:DNA-binding HxlR family transcriptional regulator
METKSGNCYNAACPAREVLGHVTGRWGGLVLGALMGGTQRYSELRARVDGISEKMLAQTLRELERDGLVIRRQYPTVPPRVDYTLTPGGREVAQRVDSLINWLQDHVADFVAAQQLHANKDEARAELAQESRDVPTRDGRSIRSQR